MTRIHCIYRSLLLAISPLCVSGFSTLMTGTCCKVNSCELISKASLYFLYVVTASAKVGLSTIVLIQQFVLLSMLLILLLELDHDYVEITSG